MKTIYLSMTADIIHHGHINIINKAVNYGEVIVGLMTDEAIASYKRVPFLKYEERKQIVESIKGVNRVVPQKTLDYTENLYLLKPDFVIHGDDWKEGTQKSVRQKVIDQIKEWNGTLIEVPYTSGVSISALDDELKKLGTTPDLRRRKLKELIRLKPFVRIIEASNGLTGLIAEKTRIELNGEIREFDGMWVSSLCDSILKGKPDIELVDSTSRLNTINEILDVTTKPIILDGDTGGLSEHFVFNVRTLERLGVSAIIIEDKIGLKKNSLFGTDVSQTQDDPHFFAKKISQGKKSLVTKDFMIIARIESLILKKGVKDAVERAKIYIDNGADGIMIHSKEKEYSEVQSFCELYEKLSSRVPLTVVPTTYNRVTENELKNMGANVIIYANHLLRSAYPAMKHTAELILQHGRSLEADKNLMPIKEILTLIPEESNA